MRWNLKGAAALACLLVGCGRSESGRREAGFEGVRDSGLVQPDASTGEEERGCRGPGRYQAGKEGSYRPCCPGLREVLYLSPAYHVTFDADPVSSSEGGSKVCIRLPLRVYACVQGRCGDGVCEEGEAEACGCVADCPSAIWGEVPTGEQGDGTGDGRGSDASRPVDGPAIDAPVTADVADGRAGSGGIDGGLGSGGSALRTGAGGSGGAGASGGTVSTGGTGGVGGSDGTARADDAGSSTMPIMCSPPSTPTYGDVDVSSLAPGSKATYSCRAGYNLGGLATRTCLEDGSWSNQVPTCIPAIAYPEICTGGEVNLLYGDNDATLSGKAPLCLGVDLALGASVKITMTLLGGPLWAFALARGWVGSSLYGNDKKQDFSPVQAQGKSETIFYSALSCSPGSVQIDYYENGSLARSKTVQWECPSRSSTR